MDSCSKRDMIRIKKLPTSVINWIGSTTSLILHTIFFLASFGLALFHIVEFADMLLWLTTIVSLEAIYLSIFIQMSVNRSNQYIEIIHEDVDEISENIDELVEDDEESDIIESLQETVNRLQKEIDVLKKNKRSK